MNNCTINLSDNSCTFNGEVYDLEIKVRDQNNIDLEKYNDLITPLLQAIFEQSVPDNKNFNNLHIRAFDTPGATGENSIIDRVDLQLDSENIEAISDKALKGLKNGPTSTEMKVIDAFKHVYPFIKQNTAILQEDDKLQYSRPESTPSDPAATKTTSTSEDTAPVIDCFLRKRSINDDDNDQVKDAWEINSLECMDRAKSDCEEAKT